MHIGGLWGHWSIGVVMVAVFWAAHARADEPFACIARKQGVRYTVKLDGTSDHRSMTVLDSRGSITSGRASVYRRGTRFYLAGAGGTGFKLGIDGESASLCFADGGRDCYTCEPIASRRERYLAKQVCATTTPNGPYVATLYRSGEPTSELVLEDAMGELASGPVTRLFHAEEIVQLSIGPSERYTYWVDAQFLCTSDPNECYACEQRSYEDNDEGTRLPETVLAACSTPTKEVTLIEQGGDHFMTWRSLEPQLGAGQQAAPAIYAGGDRWISALDEITLSSGVSEPCTFTQGLGAATEGF